MNHTGGIMSQEHENPLVISYLTLRKAIGYLGIALPFVLYFGGKLLHGLGMQSSISAYYHTEMGDVFVGTMCSIGVFMAAYKGYEKQDDIAGDLACLFAVGVALFPTAPDAPSQQDKFIGAIHLTSAALFFLTLSFFSLYLFRKTNPDKTPTRQKLNRNKVYRVCGYTMLGALALILATKLLPESAAETIQRVKPIFWLEGIAIEAFGVSWMTKGEAILKDEA
jgi:hypothetical protein